MRCQRYAGAMSASCSNHLAYEGTRYIVGKIMLRNSAPVIRTHSCASRAPTGCIARNPGINRSIIDCVDSISSIRGSVS
jgi:hypothetical protein